MLAVNIYQQITKFLKGVDGDRMAVEKSAGGLAFEHQAAERTLAGFVT